MLPQWQDYEVQLTEHLQAIREAAERLTAAEAQYEQREKLAYEEMQKTREEVKLLLDELSMARRERLLGHVAYVLDVAAAKYVLGSAYERYLSLDDLEERVAELSVEQTERWKKFCSFVVVAAEKEEGEDVGEDEADQVQTFLDKARSVRSLGFNNARAERETVTMEVLQEWAGESFGDLKGLFDSVLSVGKLLAKEGQPLIGAPPEQVAQVVEKGVQGKA